MNQITRDIAARFNITLEQALEVQGIINSCIFPDWSECSKREYDLTLAEGFHIWTVGEDVYFAEIDALIKAGK